MAIGTQISYTSAGFLSTQQIGTGRLLLTHVGGYNDSTTDAYLLLFNKAVPVAADVPAQSFKVPAGASFAWGPAQGGQLFTVALSWAVSSTGNLYTAAALNFWVFAKAFSQV